MHKTALYHDICRGLDVEYMLAVVVPLAHGRMAGWSFLRRRTMENFGSHDKFTMNLLLPHLVRAIAMRRELLGLSQHSVALEEALSCSSPAVFLINTEKQVLFLNDRAQRLVNRDDGLSVVDNRLRCWLPRFQERLQREIATCTSRGASGSVDAAPILIPTKRSAATLRCVVYPISRNVDNPFSDSRTACSVMVYESPGEIPLSAEYIARLHGLTTAESAVASHLYEGRFPAQISEMHHVSINTIRAQMKSLFRKCGVRSQSQLIRLLARGAAHDSFTGSAQ